MLFCHHEIQFENVSLVRCEIFGLFVNTFMAAGKYSPFNRENFRQPIQMQLSQKPKTFIQFFITVLKFTSRFKNVERKDKPQSFSICETIGSEKCAYLNVLHVLLNNTLPQPTCLSVPKTSEICTTAL